MLNEKEKLNNIIELSSELNNIQDLDILLEKILFETRKFTNADAGTIYIKEGNSLIFRQVQNDTQQMDLAPNEKLLYTFFKVTIDKESIAGYTGLTGVTINIPDVYKLGKTVSYKFADEYDDFTGYKTQSMLALPLRDLQEDVMGVLQIINKKDEKGKIIPFNEEDENFVKHFANTASIVIQRARLTRTLIMRMIMMSQLRDPSETGQHVNRVASFSVELYERWAEAKNIPVDEIEKNRDVLRIAAMLHDIGKVGVSDLILKKAGKLTAEEFEIMKGHTFIGAKILQEKESVFDATSSIVALTHHENWDGTGYPGLYNEMNSRKKSSVLKGEDIPIFGRVVALADVYDALISKRVYKEAWDENSAVEEIKKLSGKKFDPFLVDIFLASLNKLRTLADRFSEDHVSYSD